MGKKKPIHTVPHPDGWANKREGVDRASSVHRTQSDAWQANKKTARADKTEAYLHNEKGRIRERESYGNDLHPPKG
jgi:hypothetical protein